MLEPKPIKIVNLQSVDSTNNYVWDAALKGEPEILVVRATAQTQGKGRLGRTWVSRPGGLYVSFLLRPQNNIQELCFLPIALGLAVVKTLSDVAAVKIKWPNDVYLNGKKLCGILVEARSSREKAEFAVAGIGINVNIPAADLPEHATSLLIETGQIQDMPVLFKKLVSRVLTVYNSFGRGEINDLLKEVQPYLVEPQDLTNAVNLSRTINLR